MYCAGRAGEADSLDMTSDNPWITVLGSFIADLTVRAPNLPAWGETVLGADFTVGAGGKGSNQAVAAARLGARVCFITKLGRDAFGELARATWRADGIDAAFVTESPDRGTGAAAVILHAEHGENAIVVDPGSAMQLTIADIDAAAARIAGSAVFMAQLEVPRDVLARGLSLAHAAGALTILNPAPALPVADAVFADCDYLTPNETEAAALAGFPVASVADAERAAAALLVRGARCVIVTLGARGALVKNAALTVHVSAIDAGPVVETTGAGDAFNGALAVALSEGTELVAATRFACAAAGLSVTRAGTSASMPTRAEVDAAVRR